MELSKLGDIYEMSFEGNGSEWDQWVLLLSDVHFDSTVCDRDLLREHLLQARSRKADVLIFGDMFDVMGAKHDPRSDKSQIRPEYNVPNYLDAVVKDAAKYFKGFNIKLIGMGNHERNIERRHETNVIERIADKIGALAVGYTGFIRFVFREPSGKSRSLDMYFNHGSGGSAPVTKGTIQTNRRNASIDADIFVSGHNHNRWMMETTRFFADGVGSLRSKAVHHINLGAYKDHDTWEGEMGFPAPNKGGVWLHLKKQVRDGKVSLKYDAIYA